MIVYIHGASATAESFNYIRSNISEESICLEYDSKDGFSENLADMAKEIEKFDKVFFIAHSLGGIYSLHLAQQFPKKVQGAVTLSTPYGGSKAADYVKYFLPFSRLLRDIGPSSFPIQKIKDFKIPKNWCNIVSMRGQSPFMIEKNDGVVTIASMMHLADKMEIVEVDINHYEVVISTQVINLIKERLPT